MLYLGCGQIPLAVVHVLQVYKDPLQNTVYDKFGGHFFYCPKVYLIKKNLRSITSNSGVVTVKTLYSWSWSMVNIFRAKRATIASPNFRAPNGSCLRPISPRLLRTNPGTPKPSFFLKRRREVFFLDDLQGLIFCWKHHKKVQTKLPRKKMADSLSLNKVEENEFLPLHSWVQCSHIQPLLVNRATLLTRKFTRFPISHV